MKQEEGTDAASHEIQFIQQIETFDRTPVEHPEDWDEPSALKNPESFRIVREALPRDREIGKGSALDREIWITGLCVLFSLIASSVVVFELAQVLFGQLVQYRWLAAAGHILFSVIIGFLIYGGLIFQVTRGIYLIRRRRHQPVHIDESGLASSERLPSVTILVPSYCEEAEVVRKTLLSAALQNYPDKRIILLIDDPPEDGSEQPAESLVSMYSMVAELQDWFECRQARIESRREKARRARRHKHGYRTTNESLEIAELYMELADELVGLQQIPGMDDPAGRVLCNGVFFSQAESLYSHANRLTDLSEKQIECHPSELNRAYERLLAIFEIHLDCFERKRYENLSHEVNKAMNLNAYIGLMGDSYEIVFEQGNQHLKSSASENASLVVPDTDYIITLDADSIIVADYTKTLVSLAEKPGNERLAVIQTPYSAFPGATTEIERIAGATTDIQYVIHQGFMGGDAAYWVGANAVLRKASLEDIAIKVQERGYTIPVYIQDRTVIEDTESTVDLIERNWRLFNYPERMAYSATPADFGSLLIQRRRWANGGLIILPKLLRYLSRRRKDDARPKLKIFAEATMRIHYLVSITAINFGLVIILAVPFTESIRSMWLPLAALPYFILYARELRMCGYRTLDFFKVYALNLVLIPVNIGGVLKSIEQACRRTKIPFARTPKVEGHTAVAAIYLLAAIALLLTWTGQAAIDVKVGLYFHAAFAIGNAAILYYGIRNFIGFREASMDIRAAIYRD
jgi:cellulose synthase/poly-beta-1,6-N-acetylglucosamine synthase-like glycosyltransferase